MFIVLHVLLEDTDFLADGIFRTITTDDIPVTKIPKYDSCKT